MIGRSVLEDDQIEELRRWARGVAEDTRPELRAAAKAILLLADDLLAARGQLLEYRWIKWALEEHEADMERTLRNRLRRLVHARNRSEADPETVEN
jgi:hypothetical protein